MNIHGMDRTSAERVIHTCAGDDLVESAVDWCECGAGDGKVRQLICQSSRLDCLHSSALLLFKYINASDDLTLHLTTDTGHNGEDTRA